MAFINRRRVGVESRLCVDLLHVRMAPEHMSTCLHYFVCVCVCGRLGVWVCVNAIRITVGLPCGFKAYFGHIHSTNHPLKPVEEVTFVQHDVQHIEICHQRACGS